MSAFTEKPGSTEEARSIPIRNPRLRIRRSAAGTLATASARDATPSFRNSASMWNLTVCGENPEQPRRFLVGQAVAESAEHLDFARCQQDRRFLWQPLESSRR